MKKIALKYALWMFTGFMGFFLLMFVAGYASNPNLRIFNSVFHISLISAAIFNYRKSFPETVHNYVSGVGMGFYSSIPAVGAFALFMFLFLTGNPELMSSIDNQIPVDLGLSPMTAAAFMFVEGVAVTLIGSYIVTRIVDTYMENADNIPTTAYER